MNGQCQYLNTTIIKISKYPVPTYNHHCKNSHTGLLYVTMVVMFFLEKPNNHLENHRFFRKLGVLEPTVLWFRFSQIPERTQSISLILFFKYPELAVIKKSKNRPPHLGGVNSEVPLKEITLESVNPGGVGWGFNPQDSRGVDHTTYTHLGRFVFF